MRISDEQIDRMYGDCICTETEMQLIERLRIADLALSKACDHREELMNVYRGHAERELIAEGKVRVQP